MRGGRSSAGAGRGGGRAGCWNLDVLSLELKGFCSCKDDVVLEQCCPLGII